MLISGKVCLCPSFFFQVKRITYPKQAAFRLLFVWILCFRDKDKPATDPKGYPDYGFYDPFYRPAQQLWAIPDVFPPLPALSCPPDAGKQTARPAILSSGGK